jgi:hypothetical protein
MNFPLTQRFRRWMNVTVKVLESCLFFSRARLLPQVACKPDGFSFLPNPKSVAFP